MPQLRIERVPIDGLQVSGFDHLHLVLEPDIINNSTYPQDEWLAIEGSFSGPAGAAVLSTLGGSGSETLSDLNFGLAGTALQDVIGTPGTRGSRILTTIGDANVQWQFMASLARDIDSQQLPYQAQPIGSRYLFNINSSSVISTLLYAIGIDITNNFPYGTARTNGWQTLLGTSGDDTLRIENSFVNLVGGPGDDTFFGSDARGQFERFSGGSGNDQFFWSEGSHTFHGGQSRLDYASDGIDTIDYSDVGEVSFEINPARVPHLGADIIATHARGQDYLLSIEKLSWRTDSDTVHLGEGLSLLFESIELDLGQQSSTDQGDTINFSEADGAVRLVAATNPDFTFAQASASSNGDVGVWLNSVEWIIGSEHDDVAYLGWDVRGFEGGGGNDFIDTRDVAAFEGNSPNGYDVEIYGGDGSDTIVVGNGVTYANGGAGGDIFVVSELSDPLNGMNELIIDGADSSDRLFASYNFFNQSNAPFEGASLFPLLGAISQFAGEASFADLPQNEGSFGDANGREDFFPLYWQTNDDRFFADDETMGVLDFAGGVYYNLDGDDLLIHVLSGIGVPFDEVGENGSEYTYIASLNAIDSEVLIRVVDFQEGMLGINFYVIGEGEDFDYSRPHGDYTGTVFPNWDETVNTLTNNGVLTAPLDPRPDAPTYDPDADAPPPAPVVVIGSIASDVMTVASSLNHEIHAGEGDDVITTADGDDRIDGGDGIDQMAGGSGNDTYIVDNQDDIVIETAGQGTDTVLSSSSYTLSDNVEHLTLLEGPPESFSQSTVLRTTVPLTEQDATGNTLANILTGNTRANTLDGRDGNDILLGLGGNDVLIGGEGNDIYYYFAGDGDDKIRDFGDEDDIDHILLEGILPEQVTFLQRSDTPDDLVITFTIGGRIEVIDFFADNDSDSGIEMVTASGTQTWDRDEIETIVFESGSVDNEAPQALDDDVFVLRGPDATLSSSALLANDRDFDGDVLSITAVSSDNPEISVALDDSGNISISSAVGFQGSATLTYTVSDDRGGQASATAGLALYPNQAPTIEPIADQHSLEDAQWMFTLDPASVSDADGDQITLDARLGDGSELPSWLTFNPAATTFQALPPQNFNGTVSLQVLASDGDAITVADFDLIIVPVNDAPVAQDDTGLETNENQTLVIEAASLLENDSDVDGDVVTINATSNTQNGTATVLDNGNISFQPDAGYSGTASFDYSIDDGNGGTGTATVTLTVIADPNPPDPATIVGTPGRDWLYGTGDDDRFDGLDGRDVMVGRRGDDTFLGGNGRDVMLGGRGYDTVDYSQSPEAVTVHIFGLGIGSGGHAEGDYFSSVEQIIGSEHDDVLTSFGSAIHFDGGDGNDVIRGGFSSDVLAGGRGHDRLSGSYGDDNFIFSNGDGHDVITDFNAGNARSWWHNQNDTITLDIDGIDSFLDALHHASQNSSDVIFNFGQADSLTLQNVQLSQLQENDFLFI